MLNKLIKDDCIRTRQDRKNKLKEIKKKYVCIQC